MLNFILCYYFCRAEAYLLYRGTCLKKSYQTNRFCSIIRCLHIWTLTNRWKNTRTVWRSLLDSRLVFPCPFLFVFSNFLFLFSFSIVMCKLIFDWLKFFQNYLSCCSITDCAVETLQGYNVKDSVAIKSKYGNQLINYEK